MNEITLLKPTSKGEAGDVLRVWESGDLRKDMVDPQRAEQWIADGIARAGSTQTKKKAPAKKEPPARKGKGK